MIAIFKEIITSMPVKLEFDTIFEAFEYQRLNVHMKLIKIKIKIDKDFHLKE